MGDINLLLADISTTIVQLNKMWLKVVDALKQETDYVTLDEAEEISGLTKRQLRYRADSGDIRTRRINERTRLYSRNDLESNHRQRR